MSARRRASPRLRSRRSTCTLWLACRRSHFAACGARPEGLDVAALSSTLDACCCPAVFPTSIQSATERKSSDAAPYDLQRDALVWPLVDALVARVSLCLASSWDAGAERYLGRQPLPGSTSRLRAWITVLRREKRTALRRQPYGAGHGWRWPTALATAHAWLGVILRAAGCCGKLPHWQGVARLGAGLRLRRARPMANRFSCHRCTRLCTRVQWHPEVAPERDPYSAALFRRFGQALAAQRRAILLASVASLSLRLVRGRKKSYCRRASLFSYRSCQQVRDLALSIELLLNPSLGSRCIYGGYMEPFGYRVACCVAALASLLACLKYGLSLTGIWRHALAGTVAL